MNNNPLRQRAHLLRVAADNPELQSLLLELCRRDIGFWFRHFCWTFDPRLPQPHQPFLLYPYQVEVLRSIQHALEHGEDLLIEKSRDMGLSWLILLAFQHAWLFHIGANFHLGSRKEDMVDRKGDISTLFEKLRYNLDWLPAWMKPPGFSTSQHDNLLRLLNPANGNVISGDSAGENFGRGGRYRGVLFDEFPFWGKADVAYASAGQSTHCRITVGTPYGKHNRFAELRFGGQTRILTVHWRQHPLKDEAWYRRQCQRMSEDEIARELDINYNLSVKDRVFRQFGPEHQRKLLTAPVAAMPEDPIQTGHARRIIRSWDFGYHCPACLFLQFDEQDRLMVLHEEVGHMDLLVDFARRVQASSDRLFPDRRFEDICDPAGAQRSDKSTHTSIEILNSLGIYPSYDRSAIRDGIELIRMKLAERIDGLPALLVDTGCAKLIAAFEGGYRYAKSDSEQPLEEHPHEDVMDCLRYAVMAKCGIVSRSPRKARQYRPQNRYTGY